METTVFGVGVPLCAKAAGVNCRTCSVWKSATQRLPEASNASPSGILESAKHDRWHDIAPGLTL